MKDKPSHLDNSRDRSAQAGDSVRSLARLLARAAAREWIEDGSPAQLGVKLGHGERSKHHRSKQTADRRRGG